jgi:CxxH/CxxC protein (TIGR04129 family)
MKIMCCMEHVELALDIIVDEYECAPIIHNVESDQNTAETCEYCQNEATYIVST